MEGKPQRLARWMLACALTAVAGCTPGGRSGSDPAPEALFAEAERLRLAYQEEASHEAILEYRAARAAWIRKGDLARAAMAARMLGATWEQLGFLDDALREYREAASLCDGCDSLLESAIVSDVGLIQARLADSEESLDSALVECQRALSLARRAGGVREVAEALTCAGETEYHRGNLEAALALYREAKSNWESVADPRGQAETLFYEGTVRSDWSQFAEARANLESARSLWTSSRDERGEAMALIALGRLEHRQSKYQIALNHFRQALDRLEPAGDLVWQASGLAGIGIVYFDMGDAARARSYWETALERYQKTGLHTATWDLTLAVGTADLTLNDPSRALRNFQQALELAEKTKSHRWQAYSLYFMSRALQSVGDPEESLKSLERALVLERSARDRRLEAAIRSEMGNTHELMGRHGLATESFGRALELTRKSHDRAGEAVALFGMARVSRARNDLDAARNHIEGALRVAESLRTEVESRALRTSYLASIYRLHELYVDVLMELDELRPGAGFAAAAFAASERARARSLLDSLTEADVDIRVGVDPRLLEREASLKRRLDESVGRRVRLNGAGDEGEVEALDHKIRDLEAKYDLALAEIRSKSPRYAALVPRHPLGLREVQEQLLDHDTLLLAYALGEERSFLWAVSREESAVFALSPRAEIEGQAQRLYDLLTARARFEAESLQARNRRLEKADADYWEAAARMSRILLGPVADRMAGKKLVLVTDGALQFLPFGALPAPGSANDVVPMIVAHEITNLPSASALALLREETLGRNRPEGTVAVFADPVFAPDDPRLDARKQPGSSDGAKHADSSPSSENHSQMSQTLPEVFLRSGELSIPRLQASRHEAAAIVALAPEGTTMQAIDFDASRSVAMSPVLRNYRIVHFATHGLFNTENPATSGVLLSLFDARGRAQEGLLRLHDIYDLHLSAELVVLSACSTALGKPIRGEGIVGIVRAFMYAGAESVVATLWKVDDEATHELMSRFYREMFEAQRSPSAALREAQLATWRETEWRAPFYWAAFVLQGEWRED